MTQASPILGAYFCIAHTIGTQFFAELKSKYVLKVIDFSEAQGDRGHEVQESQWITTEKTKAELFKN